MELTKSAAEKLTQLYGEVSDVLNCYDKDPVCVGNEKMLYFTLIKVQSEMEKAMSLPR